MFIASLVGLWLFACLLGLTFLGQETLKDFARDYINRRIEPKVTRAATMIEREVLPRLGQDDPQTALQISGEITRYRQDPLAYIDAITSARMTPEPGPKTKAMQAAKDLSARFHSITTAVADHFRQVFERLVLDLRIFAISNIIGFAVVAWVTRHSATSSPRLHVQAFILFVATVHAMSVYINQNWFFNLLLDFHMGIWYPLSIAATSVDLWYRWRKRQLRASVRELVADVVK
jgi:hypothetical protein